MRHHCGKQKESWRAVAARTQGQDGSIILMTLLLLLVFVGVGFAFRQLMSLEGHTVAAHLDREQAAECARAGLEIALSLLRADDPSVDALSEAWASSPRLSGEIGTGASYSLLPTDELPDDGIEDLQSRLPIGQLSAARLQSLPGMPVQQPIAEATPRAPFQSVTHFMEVSAMDGEAFQAATGHVPQDLLTVFGSGMVNVNTATSAALALLLEDPAQAEAIVTHRRGADGIDGTGDDEPFQNLEQVRGVVGPAAVLPPELSVRSEWFLIRVTGELRSGTNFSRYRLEAVLRRSADGIEILQVREI